MISNASKSTSRPTRRNFSAVGLLDHATDFANKVFHTRGELSPMFVAVTGQRAFVICTP